MIQTWLQTQKKLYTLGLTQKKRFWLRSQIGEAFNSSFPSGKKRQNSLVSGNSPGEFFLSLTRLHSRMCIRIYIFNFKKTKKQNKNNTKQSKTRSQKKAKETKEKIICGKFNGKRLYSLRICSVFF